MSKPAEARCLFCGEDMLRPGHLLRCDGRQGAVEAEAHARWSDPETSHQAAASLQPAVLNRIQERVRFLLASCGPMHHAQLIHAYRLQYGTVGESTIRTRCRELSDLGVVRDTGRRITLPSGRQSIVWSIK